MKTAIIDYEAGNLANAYRAAERAGLDCVVTRDPAVIRDADSLILPGVGAMKDAMDHLNAFGLTELLREEARNGKKLVGICLGMQAFCDTSEEGGCVAGLGLIPGRVVRFPAGLLKVPHMGWNELVSGKSTGFSRGFRSIPMCISYIPTTRRRLTRRTSSPARNTASPCRPSSAGTMCWAFSSIRKNPARWECRSGKI